MDEVEELNDAGGKDDDDDEEEEEDEELEYQRDLLALAQKAKEADPKAKAAQGTNDEVR